MSTTTIRCDAVQHSDQMQCPCGLAWDMNDPDPPECTKMRMARDLLERMAEETPRIEPTFGAGLVTQQRRSTDKATVQRDEAHARLSALTEVLRASPVAAPQAVTTFGKPTRFTLGEVATLQKAVQILDEYDHPHAAKVIRELLETR